MRLNNPEAEKAKESLAALAIAINQFVVTLQASDDEAATDEAHDIYLQALLHTLQAWCETPVVSVAIRMTLATAAISLVAVSGASLLGEAIVGAIAIGPDAVAKLIKSFKGILKLGKDGNGQ